MSKALTIWSKLFVEYSNVPLNPFGFLAAPETKFYRKIINFQY